MAPAGALLAGAHGQYALNLTPAPLPQAGEGICLNLGAARGKTLSAVQRDLVSKIQGFIKDAREAAQITDWSRARSLAKKAQVLSEELASSL